ncbi:MAG: alpha/beta hydrolase [Nocardioidaceae bacterium]|nr:alpha/beta hydrolase [Nocardioidaceae bacterium]
MPSHGNFLDRLDPEIATAVATMGDIDLSDIPATRTAMSQTMPPSQSTPGVRSTDRVFPASGARAEFAARIHRPDTDSHGIPALLWVHGGGHVVGHAGQDDVTLQALVARTGCVAVAVEWRKSPENPYPDSLDDCYAALQWMASPDNDLGIDPHRIMVAGVSSGGGVAAGLALLARDRGGPTIHAQMLLYPMLDDRELTASSTSFVDQRVWNATSNRIGWDAYLTGIDRAEVPVYAAPGRTIDLAGLPPTWIAAGELDPLVDESVDYAQRLMTAGVSTELHVYPGAVHGFDALIPDAAVSVRLKAARDAAFDRWLSA